MTEGHLLYAGIDWATEVHDVCVVDHEGKVLGERRFKHTSEGLGQLCDWFAELSKRESSDVHCAIELTTGLVIDTLLERGIVVHSINPKQLDRFRDRFTVAGAKDDRLDALVLADSLRTDTRSYRTVEPDDPRVIALRDLSRMGDELQRDHVRLTNRVREQFRRYFPQFLRIGDEIGAGWMIAVWTRTPTPASSRRVQPGTIDKLLKKHRIRKITAEELLAVLREPAMTVAPGVAESACKQIRMLFERIKVVNEQLKQCRHDAQRVLEEMAADDEGRSGQRDVAIILSLPGVGSITCATLLAEASRAIRDRDYRALRSLSGVAPVTRRSGKRKLTIVMRQACNDRLRNAMYHAARVACQHDEACKARYHALRSRGHSHGRALRSIADRMLGILMAMLRTQTTYRVDESQAA